MDSLHPVAYMIRYGAGYACVYLERPRAEQAAANLHGILVPLYEHPASPVIAGHDQD